MKALSTGAGTEVWTVPFVRLHSFAICLAVTVLVGCGTQANSPAQAAPDPAIAAKMRSDYIAAWKSGSADQIAGMYTEDGVGMYPHQPVISGKAAIREYFAKFYEQFTPKSFEILSAEVVFAGDWAFDRGTYKLTITPKGGGAAINDEGKYLVVLRRQPDGSYKVARDIDNTSTPEAPPPAK